MKPLKIIKPIFIFIVFIACSCDQAFENELKNYKNKLVVDGFIELGGYPVVLLTKSSSYLSSIDSASFRDLVVSRAKVTVSDGIEEEVLTLKRNDGYFPPYVYEGTAIVGELGKTYHLKIEYQGKTYTSKTTIPEPVFIDSLWYKTLSDNDTLGFIYGKFSDNPEQDNYYRIFTKRINTDKKFAPVYLSTIGDQYFNGNSFTFSLLRGPETFSNIENDLYFQKGETVQVKISCIDKAHFDFWRTLERELYIMGNPFSSTGNEIISNINGEGVLGVWGGYGSRIYQIELK